MDKLLSKLNITPKHDKHKKRLLTNPHKDWIVILKVCSIMVLSLVVFNLYLLYQIKNEQVFQVTQASEIKSNPIKEKLLNTIKDSFDKKEKKITDIKATPVSYPDPSL